MANLINNYTPKAPIQVLGTGFGRTGTYSLKLALEQLGFGPCHHMIELARKPSEISHWQSALSGQANWQNVFQNYQSAVDWPAALFCESLLNIYPTIKFIHTTRDPESWYKSASHSIFYALEFATATMCDKKLPDWVKIARQAVLVEHFQGKHRHKEFCIDKFIKHEQWVKQTIPKEQLLIFDLTQGWKPLCEFLEVDQPEKVAFPHDNASSEFFKLLKKHYR